MRRLIILLTFLMGSFESLLAQTDKGTFTVGNSFFLRANDDKSEAVNLYVQLNNGVSYFILKDFSFGVSYNWTKVKTFDYEEYHDLEGSGAGIYVRYYLFLKQAKVGENAKFGFFFQAGANFSYTDHHFERESEDPDQFEQIFKQLYANPGMVFTVGTHWSFECSLRGLTYEQYEIENSDISWDYFGAGMNSIMNEQDYTISVNEPTFLFMGGVRYHF